jgi:hypothetical protein
MHKLINTHSLYLRNTFVRMASQILRLIKSPQVASC